MSASYHWFNAPEAPAGIPDSYDEHVKLMYDLQWLAYQADITRGTNYFRTPVSKGLEIMDKLRGHTSGLAIPDRKSTRLNSSHRT